MIYWLIGILLAMAPSVWAKDLTHTLTVDEPTNFKHADGSDWVPPVDVPASASTGGGQHTTVLTTTIPDGQVETGMAQATAVDTSGNESAVIQQPVLVDAQSPSAPVNMTVTTVVQ
jgi:hypothetical protein